MPPIEIGTKVQDTSLNRAGAIIDVARQYAHPQADPVYQYLIRWDDGQISALSETAFGRSHGLQIVEGN